MKLFQVAKWGVRRDYGREYCLTLFFTEKYSLLQVSFSVCEYTSFPHLQIIMGMGKLFGIFAYAWKFGFDVDVFGRTWWL